MGVEGGLGIWASIQFSTVFHRQSRERAWRQSVWGEQMMCRRAGWEGPEQITQSCLACLVATCKPSTPSGPSTLLADRTLTMQASPLCCGAGRDAVGWQPPPPTPRKVKKDLGFTDSASSVPHLRTVQGSDSDPDYAR